MLKIAILILAAGKSSRMGETKQLLPFGNDSILRAVIHNALQTNVNDVFVVLGANAELIKTHIVDYPIQIIHNPDYEKGLGSSIAIGIHELMDYDGVTITLADQPKVDSAYLNKLILEFNNLPDHVIASEYDGHYGVPAIFPKQYFKELTALKGDKGAKEFLNSGTILIKSVNSSVNLVDVDTPEDYQRLIQERDN